MYKKAYGIIETLAPLHVGATAGEESGNLNLIFRDQFTQTGIIPGSSIRGRLRSEMRLSHNEQEASYWYGHEAESELSEHTTESVVKFEYASILWLPVFCPGQPIVWVSCEKLLKRYKRIAGLTETVPPLYTGSKTLKALEQKLFFNFGFLSIEHPNQDLKAWFPDGKELPSVVVGDDEIGMIHDMALYRQSRVALEKKQKRVKGKAFFNTEALPEGTILVFPVAIKELNQSESDAQQKVWQPFGANNKADIYLGGLESIGFGHCEMTLKEV
ncbi:MAG: type III-B CRISPR module RAMP protein Cmr4 [Symplocastrum torsivum CPER-KK1]|jgi:CRISPR-associated protein Cmr4|uniref:Type III-B CRISPR module RAMP protein Cmr4 n=1 Tax=Symplocastrum torsivum CPER-KK1 TaxID=450513 RepID=A0A951UDQ4_9CYAN|nr:type III-B CRISPR module RAMP protein Cmr4 [Symplocastrum torsivum CPER-KK1]